MTYDGRLPPTVVYTAIEDLRDMANITHNPFTATQLMELDFAIFKQVPDFLEDLRDWVYKPSTEHRHRQKIVNC